MTTYAAARLRVLWIERLPGRRKVGGSIPDRVIPKKTLNDVTCSFPAWE